MKDRLVWKFALVALVGVVYLVGNAYYYQNITEVAIKTGSEFGREADQAALEMRLARNAYPLAGLCFTGLLAVLFVPEVYRAVQMATNSTKEGESG